VCKSFKRNIEWPMVKIFWPDPSRISAKIGRELVVKSKRNVIWNVVSLSNVKYQVWLTPGCNYPIFLPDSLPPYIPIILAWNKKHRFFVCGYFINLHLPDRLSTFSAK
jgi:hypothetical protein